MKNMRTLLEDVFMDRVNTIYDNKLRGKIDSKPSDFDSDALQLGVYHEMHKVKDMRKALIRAMLRLKKNPNHYDDSDEYGNENTPAQNQITWTGHPGIGNM